MIHEPETNPWEPSSKENPKLLDIKGHDLEIKRPKVWAWPS
jgi:hypothetical protein